MHATQLLVGADRALGDPNAGFRYAGEFLQAVRQAGRGGPLDARLKPLAAVGSDEQGEYSGPHGGFLVPIGLSPNILAVDREDPLQARVRQVPMTFPTEQIPARADKTPTATSVTGGLLLLRRPETVAPDASRGTYELVTLTANDLMGVTFATDRLLSDARSFSLALEAAFADELTSCLMEERLHGSGVGEFLGVLHAPCTITVAKEGGQAANTIVYANVRKMRSRCWRYHRAVWLANYDTQEQLQDLHQLIGTDGERVYQYAQSEDAPDMLLGRPIFYSDDPHTLGTKGDLILSNWGEYLEGTLSKQFTPSIHVRFTSVETAFRFWVRNDGRPWWGSPLTPKRGANTLSPFVVLESRT